MDWKLFLIYGLFCYTIGVVSRKLTVPFKIIFTRFKHLPSFLWGWADFIYAAASVLVVVFMAKFYWPLENEDSQLLIFVITTFTLFFQAVIGNRPYRFRNRPQIKVNFDINKTDYYHMTQIQDTWRLNNNSHLIDFIPAYYLRLRVENTGNRILKNTRVVLKEVISGKPSFIFFPLHLNWAFGGEKADLPPNGFSREVNLFEIREPKKTIELIKAADYAGGSPDRERHVALSKGFRVCSVMPNTLSDIFPVGEYRFLLIVSADNARPVSIIVNIKYDGKWTKGTDISKMRTKHLNMKIEGQV